MDAQATGGEERFDPRGTVAVAILYLVVITTIWLLAYGGAFLTRLHMGAP